MIHFRMSLLTVAVVTSCASLQTEARDIDMNQITPARVAMALNTPPTNEQLSAAGQLGGILYPTKPVENIVTQSAERLAFGRAIQMWNQHHYQQASVLFDAFRKQYPNSAWASEATLHMACNARFTGQYTLANNLFNEVIQNNIASDYIGAKQMVAKAKSRLGILRLMENNPDAAKQLFSDVHQHAPSWRLRTYTSIWLRKLSAMEEHAGNLLDCGTRALAYLLEQDARHDEAEQVLGYAPADQSEGFSLSELVKLSQSYGYETTAVNTSVLELLTLSRPAILQISREKTGGKGHYWILERVESNLFYVFDPQMNRRFIFTPAQLSQEWQGKALLFSTTTAHIGNPLTKQMMDDTRGGCCGIQRPPSESGDPDKNPDLPPDLDVVDEPKKDDCNPKGAPIWKVNMINMNLYMTDIPLWYKNNIGPDVKVQLSYNTQSVLAQNEPFGNKWMFNYATYLVVDPGNAVTIFNPDGSESVFIQDDNGQYHSDRHFSTTLTVNEQHQYELTYANGYKKVYGVPEGTTALQNFLLKESDGVGNVLTFEYDDQARMTHIVDASGQITTLNYNADDLITSVDDPFGRTARFEYDNARNLIALTDMQGYRSELAYDEERLVSSLKDAKGVTQFYIEPADGIRNGSNPYPIPGTIMWENYRITVTLPTAVKEEYYYDGYSKRSWYVNPDDYVEYESKNKSNYSNQVPKISFKFVTPNGRSSKIASVSYPDGRKKKYQYYSNNLLKSVTNQDEQVELYEWNEKGHLLSKTDLLGNQTWYDYASNDVDVTAIKDVNGTTHYQYDTTHHLIEFTNADNDKTQVTYDSAGNVSSVTDANRSLTEFLRDPKGNIVEVKKGGKVVNQYGYDSIGRLTSTQDINGYVHTFKYNNLDTLTDVTAPSGRSVAQEFGVCPRLLQKRTLPGDRVYKYQYDAQQRLAKVINPMRGRLAIERYPSGHIKSLIDQNSNPTTFEYTSMGNLSKKRYADGNTLNYTYKNGRIATVTNARGVKKYFTYNEHQQLSEVSYSDETPGFSIQYDKQGRITRVIDQWGTTQYTYDVLNRISTIDGPWALDTISLGYTSLGQIERVLVNNKLNTAYQYDALGRISNINAMGHNFSYQYQTGKQALTLNTSYPNGLQKQMHFAASGDLASILYKTPEETVAEYRYQFNEAGQLSEQTGTEAWHAPKHFFNASYNDLNQFTQWNSEASAFIYDKDGNPTQGRLSDNTPFNAVYDAESRLVELSFSRSGTHYTERYGYDFSHRLVEYQLYEDGKLTKNHRFVRLGLLELQQRDDKDNVEQEYSWNLYHQSGIGGLLLTQTSTTSYQYIYNHLGTIQKVLDANGRIVADYTYSPYGEVFGDGFSEQPFGYSTKRSDFESGLVYFGYRFYAPHLGRWLNRDPLQEQGGINLYAYVNGDPLNYVDPDGQHPILIGAAVGAINGGLGAWVMGGNFDDIVEGIALGAWGGAISVVSPIAGTMLANTMGQLIAMDRKNIPFSCFNYGSMVGAGVGTGLAAGLTSYTGATFLAMQLDFGFSTTGSITGSILFGSK